MEVDKPDPPKFILDGFIEEQKKYLEGFGGNPKTDKKRFEEASKPKHVALSLSGDATLYPKLPQLIKEVHNREMTSFLVTNGLKPEMLKRLLKEQPTQIYVTLAAPNEGVYKKVCRPMIKDAWKKLQASLSLLPNFSRSTVRLTLVKGLNMIEPESYGEIIKDLDVDFVEVKAAMPVGYAQYRMSYESMPLHEEIKKFSEEICKSAKLKIVDEKPNSRIALLMKNDFPERKLNFKD